MQKYLPAQKETMYFIGVSTAKSSIMKVFPKLMNYLDIDAQLKGIDFIPHDDPKAYYEAVEFIKNDPKSLGALITTHKIECFRACKNLFDGIGPYAIQLQEASSISKCGSELWAHAKDPITSGLALESFVPSGYFENSNAQILLLGAGGSSLALSLYLLDKSKTSKDVPQKIIVTNRSEGRLHEMKKIHTQVDSNCEVEYKLCPTALDNDSVMGSLPKGSLVINATGLGKDAPGSPLSDNAQFPQDGYVWEFNYRGELDFLQQANNSKIEKNLTIVDGWQYFIYGWTQVIAEVFHIDIPVSGPEFDKICNLAFAENTL